MLDSVFGEVEIVIEVHDATDIPARQDGHIRGYPQFHASYSLC